MTNKYILITGGLGFIGSHTCVELLSYDEAIHLVIIDDLSNCKLDVLNQIKMLVSLPDRIHFSKISLTDVVLLELLFKEYSFEFVIHFAGLKSVNDSVTNPIKYYQNNITGTLYLLELMKKYNCKKIIFSSSATVYGTQTYPVDEAAQTGIGITNPYGRTKFMLEEIFKDLYISDNDWSIIILRYFNPVGCHASGLLGENPNGKPNNLFPYILKTASGEYNKLQIFGNDYETIDGTAVRDYIHVVDLAKGHVKAIQKLNENKVHVYNLGSGTGISVLEFVNKFMEVNKINIPYVITDRRIGDLPIAYAKVDKACDELNWKTEKTIDDICNDGYNYICKLRVF